MPTKTMMIKWVRLIAMFGFLAYLASFFFLNPTGQKTLFYLLVASPALILFFDLRYLLQKENRIPVLSVLIFLTYFALSSLWSNEGRLANGLKLALCITCLMIAVHSTMSIRNNSETRICSFILAAGSCAACLYFLLFMGKILDATEYMPVVSIRYSLYTLGGFGDSNPINTAIYFGLVVLAVWWSFPQNRPLMKLGLLFLALISMMIMFLSQSRGPILSLAITLTLVSVLRRSKDELLLWGAILTSCAIIILSLNLLPLILARTDSPNDRVEIWLSAVEQIKNNLFFGHGLGHSGGIQLMGTSDLAAASHAHFSILEIFRIGGIIGGFLFLAMLLSITARSLVKSRGCSFFIFWLIFGLLCLSTNGRLLFIRPSVEWFAFWIPMFFVLFQPNGDRPDVSPYSLE
jgi:O-antigen ligase